MFALYYVRPDTQEILVCASSGHMQFYRLGEADPALFVSEDNVQSMLRKYLRLLKENKPWCGIPYVITGDKCEDLPGGKDQTLEHFRIVPVSIIPDFDKAVLARLPKR